MHRRDNSGGVRMKIYGDPKTKDGVSTKRFAIHYGKKGTHIVPAKERIQ